MKIVINNPSDYIIDVELDDDALALSDDDLAGFIDDAIRNLQSMLLTMQNSIE